MVVTRCQCGRRFRVESKLVGTIGKCEYCGSRFKIAPSGNDPAKKGVRKPDSDFDAHLSKSDKNLLVVGLAIPALLFACFLFYMLAIRDTWETDNYDAVIEMCKQAENAIASENDEDAISKYQGLASFVGNRDILNDDLAVRIDAVTNAIAPAQTRIKIAAERRLREQMAEADRRLSEQKAEADRMRRIDESRAKDAAAQHQLDVRIENYMQARWQYYESRDGGHYPERHDPLVLRDAATEFGISERQALEAFRRAPDSYYGNP